MNCYSKKCINLVTLIISIIIFIQTNIILFKVLNITNKQEMQINVKMEKLEEYTQKLSSSENSKQEENNQEDWRLIIPKINLSAQIKDGTTGEIINSYIGHFKETADINGNIGLAAHNEGYKENYFKDIDKLILDDEIIYIKGDIKKQYKVIKNVIIEETDWTYLRNSEENKITLITCVTNQPEKRRCVQAIEM
ncbi:MAG: class D sortase [Clostridia bacterium]|jgi:LPXTG-site transpeptidase (sortase) family protein|nr:class D sortase [Clostridia bacterium]